jgi:bilirubin oxidase
MKWIVGGTVTSNENNGDIPVHLADLFDPGQHTTVDHEFTFEKTGPADAPWMINGVGFEDIPNRILAKPPQGGVERWRLTNKSGGWSHPIHIHLIDFKVVSRTGGRGMQISNMLPILERRLLTERFRSCTAIRSSGSKGRCLSRRK